MYGGAGESITYITTADFVFNYSSNSQFLLDSLTAATPATHGGFDSSILRVLVNGVETYDRSFASLYDWRDFFLIAGGAVDIGAFLAGGLADVEIIFALTADSNGKRIPVRLRLRHRAGGAGVGDAVAGHADPFCLRSRRLRSAPLAQKAAGGGAGGMIK